VGVVPVVLVSVVVTIEVLEMTVDTVMVEVLLLLVASEGLREQKFTKGPVSRSLAGSWNNRPNPD
jgi:hypothetical protein